MRIGRWLLALALAVALAGAVLWVLAVADAKRIAPLAAERAAGYELSWDELSASQQAMLLAVEDPAFFEHRGIDLSTPGAGLTTITQALVKKLAFDDFRPGPLNKLRQSLIALALDRRLAKEAQLTLFVNIAGLGRHDGAWIEGFPAGAEAWYGVPLTELEDDHFAVLVARVIAPERLSRPEHAGELAERVRRIQRLTRGACEPAGVNDAWLAGCAEPAPNPPPG